jgi:hypothetical protein
VYPSVYAIAISRYFFNVLEISLSASLDTA